MHNTGKEVENEASLVVCCTHKGLLLKEKRKGTNKEEREREEREKEERKKRRRKVCNNSFVASPLIYFAP